MKKNSSSKAQMLSAKFATASSSDHMAPPPQWINTPLPVILLLLPQRTKRKECNSHLEKFATKGTDPTMSKLKNGRGDDVRRRLLHLFVCSTIYMNEEFMVRFSLPFNFLPLDSEQIRIRKKDADSDSDSEKRFQ